MADLVARVQASFARQGAMATLGAELADVAAGRVAIMVPIGPHLSQHDGFLHAGVVVAALDSACGYTALTLMPDDAEVLTVELKVNLLAPANGDRLLAEGDVLRAGRTLTVCRGDAYAEQGSDRVHVATMLATMMRGGLDDGRPSPGGVFANDARGDWAHKVLEWLSTMCGR